MMDFGLWLMAGAALGMILMAFLAIGTYQRGYDEGSHLRRPWRAELAARRQAVMDRHERPGQVAVIYREEILPQPEPLPSVAARAG